MNLRKGNIFVFSVMLTLIPLPLASYQSKDMEINTNSKKNKSKIILKPIVSGSASAKKSFKLIFSNSNGNTNNNNNNKEKRSSGFRRGSGSAVVNNPSVNSSLNISNIVDVVRLGNIAEELSSGQLQAKESAALKARQKLAQLSFQWALFAHKLTQWKSNEVMDLTKKAQAAQILSLKFGSIATRLQTAVLAAQNVYNSAFDRYKKLASLAEAAENHSTAASRALTLLQHTQSVREKWASDEQARAFRLSKHLQNILYDLKRATEFAQEAHEHALSTRQYIHFHY